MATSIQPNQTVNDLNWTFVLVGVADATMLPYIPLYLAQRGLSAALIGLVLACAALATFVVGLGWAYLADRRFSPERMVVAAAAAAAGMALLLAVAAGPVAIAAVIVGLSIARAPFMLLDPIALKRLRVTRRTDYARIRLRMSAGWAGSAVLSGALFQAAGLRLIPFVYAPLSLVLGWWVFRSLKPTTEGQTVDPTPAITSNVRRVPVALITFFASCLLLGASLAATQNFLTLQINVLGGGAVLIGAAAAFQALTEVPTMGFMHLLTKFLSHRALFAIGCGVYLVIFVAWAFTSDALAAALLKLVAGVAFALTLISAVMITNDLAPSRLRATGQTLMKSVLFGVAPIVGALGGGVVYEALGARVMFLGATTIVGAAGLIALLVRPRPAPLTTATEAAPASPGLATPPA